MTNPYGQQPGGYGQPYGGYPQGQPGVYPAAQQAPAGYPQQPSSGGFPAQAAYPGQQQAPVYPGQGGVGGPQGFGGRPNYANWGQRVGGLLIDQAIPVAMTLIGLLVMLGSLTVGAVILALGYIAGIAWSIFNRWIKGGNTGQSLGKRVTGIMLIDEQTRGPIRRGQCVRPRPGAHPRRFATLHRVPVPVVG